MPLRPLSYGLALLCLLPLASAQAAPQTRMLFLVTIDGLRWQEVFRGADPRLVADSAYVDHPEQLGRRFWADTSEERRLRLMPFLWTAISRHGQIYGNVDRGNRVALRNRHRLSYPGYSELLTGVADDRRITGNQRHHNPNVTVLEALQRQPDLRQRVAVFASWDLFPWIVNAPRSGIPVNAGLQPATGPALSRRERALNAQLAQLAHPWRRVRRDTLTHQFAMAYLERARPRVLYLAYGEPDEFAHAGDYADYLRSVRRIDDYLRELWSWAQAHASYRGRTTLIITTDHGRGEGDRWRDHGAELPGSGLSWLAILGPDTPALGEISDRTTLYSTRIASTAAALLGVDFSPATDAGHPIPEALP